MKGTREDFLKYVKHLEHQRAEEEDSCSREKENALHDFAHQYLVAC